MLNTQIEPGSFFYVQLDGDSWDVAELAHTLKHGGKLIDKGFAFGIKKGTSFERLLKGSRFYYLAFSHTASTSSEPYIFNIILPPPNGKYLMAWSDVSLLEKLPKGVFELFKIPNKKTAFIAAPAFLKGKYHCLYSPSGQTLELTSSLSFSDIVILHELRKVSSKGEDLLAKMKEFNKSYPQTKDINNIDIKDIRRIASSLFKIYPAKKCTYCGNEFKPITGRRKYCSDKCRTYYFRMKKKRSS